MGKKHTFLSLWTCFCLKSIMSDFGITMTAYLFITFFGISFFIFFPKVTIDLVCFLEAQKDGSHLLTQSVSIWVLIVRLRPLISELLLKDTDCFLSFFI